MTIIPECPLWSGFSLNTIFDATNSYRIQASTNLTTWVNLTTNASGGPQSFIDKGEPTCIVVSIARQHTVKFAPTFQLKQIKI
jgi:hypothetical protein